MVTVGQRSERVKRFLRLWVRPVVRLLFRPEVHGVENLPAEGPYMLVANHSAGMGLAEIASIAGLLGPFMGDRPMAAFVHPINYTNPVTTWIQDGLGSIPSTYDAADEALKSGVSLLVFPGGDHETLRPFWQANRVDFGGRRGFLHIARRSQVAVVPMGILIEVVDAPTEGALSAVLPTLNRRLTILSRDADLIRVGFTSDVNRHAGNHRTYGFDWFVVLWETTSRDRAAEAEAAVA